MKIFYDHQAFSSQNFGGVSRIFSELLVGVPYKSQHKVQFPFLVSNNIYLKQKGIPHMPFFPNLNIPRKYGMMYKLNNLYNAYEIKRSVFDVYHPSYYDPGLIQFAKNKPVVVTFHDMTHERLGEQYKELSAEKNIYEHKRQIAKNATHIIAVSENTKKDVVELLGVHPDKITVVYLGNSFSSVSIQPTTDKNDKDPYILYVGNRGLYKNFIPFLRAIASVLIDSQVKLKCAGGRPFNEEEKTVISQLKVEKLVNIESSATDTKLASLYTNALAFVFPSLYEGFGIPVLEAFACNCPCVLSNTTSLPEVARSAAIYFDPNNAFSIKNAVEKVINDPQLRKELIKQGQERLQYFSWEKHVKETISVYEKL